MEKKFNVAEYYIFAENNKKVGKAKIHSLVEVNGTIYAVVSYRDAADDVSCVEARPVYNLKDRAVIFLLNAGFIYADAPVLPKVVKFEVGKCYIDDSRTISQVTNKYTDSMGKTYIVLCNKFIGSVFETEIDGDVVEQAIFNNYETEISCKVTAKPFEEELHSCM